MGKSNIMLKHWLSPKMGKEIKGYSSLSDNQFGRSIDFFSEKNNNLQNIRIGIVGLDVINADKIRETLVGLSYPWPKKTILDFGNLRKSDSSFAIPFLKELSRSGIIPILIGKGEETFKTIFESISEKDKSSNLVWIQENFEQKEGDNTFWTTILSKNSYRLNSLGIIGSQSHFRTNKKLAANIAFEEIRLGKLRQNMALIEPAMRDADIVSIDANVIRYSEAQAQISKSPNGLFGEELCRISRYAGISDRVKGLSISGFDLSADEHQLTAQLIAQGIWYFIDGIMNRKGDYPFDEQNLTEYLVDVKQMSVKISFWKSTLSGRWWIQLPKSNSAEKTKMLACTYEDYLEATRGDIPERLIKALGNITSAG